MARPPGTRGTRPYLSKGVAMGLRPAAAMLEEALAADSGQLGDLDASPWIRPADRPHVEAVVRWLRENATWYLESGER